MNKQEYLFPFQKIRRVQSRMLEQVSESVERSENLLVHAPTGLGKTVASVSPALKKALKDDKTVYFLTPKHTQHKIAVDTVRKIKEEFDENIVAVDLIGKKWMCPLPASNELKNHDFTEYCSDLRKQRSCPKYSKTYDKKGSLTPEAEEFIRELGVSSPMHVEDLSEYCSERGFCPYEISLELSKKARVVIGDYYHLFHPSVKSVFLTRAEKSMSDAIIIVDESHNLPSRIRSLLSSKMTSNSLSACLKEIGDWDEKVFENLLLVIEELREEAERMRVEESRMRRSDLVTIFEESFGKPFREIVGDLTYWGEKIRKKNKKSFINGLARFLEEWGKERDGYVRIFRRKGKYFEVNKKCLDPSLASGEVFDSCHATVLMSATLNPGKMYADILGVRDAVIKEYPSPFPDENRLVLVVPETTTRYVERSDDQYANIASKCESLLKIAGKNSAVFYPSYQLLNDISSKMSLDGGVFLEERGMSKHRRQDMLKKFSTQRLVSNVLHGTMGGSFAEGIDLPGEALEFIILVGIPLSKPDLETKALIKYYDKKFGNGWGYAYVFPAMNRLIQAAGRAIRSKKDKGALVFMDKRFVKTDYFTCFPSDWNIKVTKNPEKYLQEFFS